MKRILLIILLVIFIPIVLLFIIPKIQFAILKIKYDQSNKISNTGCYSGWVSEDFNQTFIASTGFSFRYPKYLQLEIQNRRNGDPTDPNENEVQIIEAYFDSNSISFPKIHIGVEVWQNVNDLHLVSYSDKSKTPCSLISQADYRNESGSSLIGSTIYSTWSEVLFPPNASNYTYIGFYCSDGNKNQTCNLILPQILSTLKFIN